MTYRIFQHGPYLTRKKYGMKKIFLLLLVTSILSSKKISSQSQDSTIAALLAINESQLINKPLDSIIAILPSGYTAMAIYGVSTTARKLTVRYPNQVWIDLHVREFIHMDPNDSNRVWNLSLMRKEKLFKTVIYKHTTCYRNCDLR